MLHSSNDVLVCEEPGKTLLSFPSVKELHNRRLINYIFLFKGGTFFPAPVNFTGSKQGWYKTYLLVTRIVPIKRKLSLFWTHFILNRCFK